MQSHTGDLGSVSTSSECMVSSDGWGRFFADGRVVGTGE